jgi:hypothetical protein
MATITTLATPTWDMTAMAMDMVAMATVNHKPADRTAGHWTTAVTRGLNPRIQSILEEMAA